MDMLTMSAKEVNRLEVMQRLEEKRMKQKAAAELLGSREPAVWCRSGAGSRAAIN
jgi:predicted XRE-type DNA-binding protein